MSSADDVTSDASSPTKTGNPSPRLDSVDMVRGIIMVLMVLDHTRDFFTRERFDPSDLSITTPAFFFTRWVTHFCAPGFMFLAGLGAFLARARGKSRPELAWFLATRGLWLIVLEETVARIGLTFSLTSAPLLAIVLWALGASMMVLSLLVFLPTPVIAAFGLILVCGHNLFDRVTPEQIGGIGGAVWKILHVPGLVQLSNNVQVFVGYPLVPWIGVMALGYAFGEAFRRKPAERFRITLGLGLLLCLAFVVLRATNLYGDPQPWSFQRSPIFTLLSFLNCNKYPPSLLFLLMTLGPLLLALAIVDRWNPGPIARPFVLLGRVPLFYYLLQWPVIHLLAIGVGAAAGQPYNALLANGPFNLPPEYGYSLPVVYVMWVVVVLLLIPPCAWFAALKKRRRDAWLSYF
jgi:uncharacterized membrane protein